MPFDRSTPDVRPCPRCEAGRHRVRYVEPPFRVVTCRGCGLTYLGNPPTDESELYEDYHHGARASGEAPAYAPDSPSSSLAEAFAINEQRVEMLAERVPDGRLLDVGCGRGYFLETARRHGYEVRGVDISERAAVFAREAFGVEATTETLDDLAARGEAFDVVTLWHVLEHFLDPSEVLEQLRGLLTPNGVCVVEVPNLRSLKFMLARQKWEGGNHPRYHRTFFTARTLRRALREAGFSHVERVPISYRVPGRSGTYEAAKALLNIVAMDAFLDFVAWK